MVHCTPAAAMLLKSARERLGLPATYGLRLRPSDDPQSQSGVELGFTDAPHPGDEVHEEAGARLFVAPELTTRFGGGLTIDASSDRSSDLVLRRVEVS